MNNDNLKQFYFCQKCEDFYIENAISMNFKSYLSSVISNNIGSCPKKHLRKVNKEYMMYLPYKPDRISKSPVLCLDIVEFSKKTQIEQFNNFSILHAACLEIFSNKEYNDGIYKGTGDGFIIGLPNHTILETIKFCEILIDNYLKNVKFFKYRIGIDYGLYFRYLDFNKKYDLFGEKVINVTRIADFGRKNNILLSADAADNIKNDKNLTELGFCLDKHRNPHKVFNYYSTIIGSDFE